METGTAKRLTEIYRERESDREREREANGSEGRETLSCHTAFT